LATLILLNNFLHDFSAAGWLFGAVILWSILRKEVPVGDAGRTVIDVLKTVLRLMQLSVAGIVIFGLIVKHVIFTGVFVLGLVYYLRARKLVKKQ
jgi:hypothetical protein